MRFLYNLVVILVAAILKIVALFSSKIKKFVVGRKYVFNQLNGVLAIEKTVVWIHAASLGEFEQGRPLIEEIKETYENCQIVLTFFSPSGYEIRKNYELADVVCYLPLDTKKNARQFLQKINPKVAVFIKYEFWPNYLIELSKRNIPTFLVSGIFRKDQIFFKPQGFWMRNVLKGIQYFFVQDIASQKLLNSIGIKSVVAGDTRFDRVAKLLENNEVLPFVERFKDSSFLVVAGSTWLADEEHLVAYINSEASKHQKFVIAPHNINSKDIERLMSVLQKKTVLFSEKETKNLKDFDVFIIDTIGILSKIYAYADVAYVGGGYTKSGVHNTLEAATYGLPIVIGPNFKKFKEVQDLVALKGCVSTFDAESCATELTTLYENENVRKEKSAITKQYVQQNLGATHKIMTALSKYLRHEK